MNFDPILYGPLFVRDAPDVNLVASGADPVEVTVSAGGASWPLPVTPVLKDASYVAPLRMREILASVVDIPGLADAGARDVPMVTLSAGDASMSLRVVYGSAAGRTPAQLAGHWLTWRDQVSKTQPWGRERLTFLAGRDLLGWQSGTYTVRAKVFFASGDPETVTLASGTLQAGCQYVTVDASYAVIAAAVHSAGTITAWDVSYAFSGRNATGAVSLDGYPLRLVLSRRDVRVKEFVFCNSFGVEDRVYSSGRSNPKVEGTSVAFLNGGVESELRNDAEEGKEVYSGHISSARDGALWTDFLKARDRHILLSGSLEQIVVDSHETDLQDNAIGSVKFTYHLSKLDAGRFFQDAEGLGDYDPGQQYGALYVGDEPAAEELPSEDLFFLKTRLDEFPAADLTEELLFLVQNPLTQAWGNAPLSALKDWLQEAVSARQTPVWSGPWSEYSAGVADYALAASLGRDLYDRIQNIERNPYSLPVASDTRLGGIRVGAGLSIDANGVLSSPAVQPGDIKILSLKVGGSTIGSYNPVGTDSTELTITSQHLYDAIGSTKYHPFGGENDAAAEKTFYIGGALFTWHPASESTPGYLELGSALVTRGDQIVISGTPGQAGGGGGAGYLYELNDVYSKGLKAAVFRADDSPKGNGDLLAYNSTKGAWVALPQSAVAPDLSNYYTKSQINAITISAGTGLTGGGTLEQNRTISLSPETINSLTLADSAYQKPAGGIPNADIASPWVKVGTTQIDLGGQQTSLAGLVNVTMTGELTIGTAKIWWDSEKGALRIDQALITEGDQIVISGTPGQGGGGGGAGYLYDLNDVYSGGLKQAVLRADDSPKGNGDLLAYNSTKGAWVALPQSSILAGYALESYVDSEIYDAIAALNLGAAATRGVASSIGSGVTGLTPGSLIYAVLGDAFDSTNTVKAFVNSSISTATATFRGTNTTATTESAFLAWANALTHDLNDYVFWATTDAAGNTVYKRYKYDGTQWVFEYDLNNSSFTAAQWSAINSGITATKVGYYDTIRGYFNNGVLGVANGGTGKSSWTTNGVVYASSASVLGQVANVTGNSQKKFLTQSTNASGAAQAPTWGAIAFSDLPAMYWANVQVKNASDSATTPTVASVLATTRATIGASSLNTSYVLAVTGASYLNGDVTVPKTKKVKIGDAELIWVDGVSNNPGYLSINCAIVTAGDQIVNAGTPGQGGGSGTIPYLHELQDVTITNIGTGNLIQWNGSAWVNVAANTVGVTSLASASANGLMSSSDYSKLAGIEANANNYTLPLAANGTRGGIQIGFTTSATNRNYAVQLSNEKAYVNVPWVAYSAGTAANVSGADTTAKVWSGSVLKSAIEAYAGVNKTGTVTEVKMTVPLGLSVSGSPITTSGTLAIAFADGFSIPTTAKQGNWDTAYGWGNHANAGYLLATTAEELYQPLDADLTAIAALTGPATGQAFLKRQNDNTWVLDTNAYLTGNEMITLSGDVSGSGTTSIAVSIGAGKVTNAMLAGSIANAKLANSAITINGSPTSLGGSFNTANITAGTAGTSAATNGYTLAVPYVTMNKYGIVTGYGTHTHTINNIPNSSLANSSVTIGTTSVALGGSATSLAGLVNVTMSGELTIGTAKIWWDSEKGALRIDQALITEGDQIVISGTPGQGGGGGGAGYLYELEDVYSNGLKQAVLRADNSAKQNNDVLSYNSTKGAWVARALGGASTYGVASSVSQNDTTHLVTGAAVWAAIDALPEPMLFKGSLGTGGTVTTLPAASSTNEGWTYKVITAGTYQGISAKVGDTFISNGSAWVIIPSGDEPSGTVTSVGLTVPTGLSVSGSPITTSGTLAISFASGYSIPTTAKQGNWDAVYGYFSSGVLPYNHGGTGLSSYAKGNLIYASAANTLAKLAANSTTTKKFLSMTSSVPSWATLGASDIPDLSWNKITSDTPTTLSGYGITDAKFGTAGTDYVPVTLGATTKNVLTAHQSVSLAGGTNNGTLKLTVNGTATNNIAVTGLADAAYKGVDTTISAGSTSAKLPTSAAVASFVEDKGYVTSSGVTSITLTSGTGIAVSDSGTAITGTGTRTISLNVAGAKTALGLGSMAYETKTDYVTIATANTITAKHTFSNGLLLNTATSWTNSDRALYFSADADDSNLRYYYTDSSKGLTYNPSTGALKAASFVKRGGTSSQFLKADGSVDDTTYVPATRTINGEALSSNVTLTLDDISNGSTRSLANYVLKAGDTMTGDLIIEKTGGGLTIRGGIDNSNSNGGYIYLAARYYNGERNGCKIASEYPGSGAYDVQDLVFYSSDNRSGDAAPVWVEAMRIKANADIVAPSFSGASTFKGGIVLPNSTALRVTSRADTPAIIDALYLSANNNLLLGYGVAGAGFNTAIYGNNVYLRYGTSRNLGMTLNSSGNVTIGDSDLAGTSTKLHVDGSITISFDNAIRWLDSNNTAYSVLSLSTSNHIYLGYGASGAGSNTNIYGVETKFYTTTSRTLTATINSTGLSVTGDITASATGTFNKIAITSTTGEAHLAFGRGGYNYITAPASGSINFVPNGLTLSSANSRLSVADSEVAVTKASGEALLAIQSTAANGAAGTIWFRARSSSYNGIKLVGNPGLTSSNTYDKISLDFMAANGTSASSVTWKRVMRITYGGNIIVGASGATSTFTQYGDMTINGSITSTGDQVVNSDATLKKNWRDLKYGVADIAKATAGVFDWKDGKGSSAGTKAQDWMHLVPQLVHGEEGHMSLAYGQIAMLNSILIAREVVEHEDEITKLRKRVSELEEEVKQLKIRS